VCSGISKGSTHNQSTGRKRLSVNIS
jgi:hypothetical protein